MQLVLTGGSLLWGELEHEVANFCSGAFSAVNFLLRGLIMFLHFEPDGMNG